MNATQETKTKKATKKAAETKTETVKATKKAAETKTETVKATKTLTKEERTQRSEAYKAKRLESATKRFETLKQVKTKAAGFASVTLANLHTAAACNANVQGAIDALNGLIKVVASVNGLDKKVVAALKGEAAQTILSQVTEITLPLYVDNKGNYKVETLYRLVASKAKNEDLRTVLKNMEKAK